nr:hypothetical protein CFP56_79543 [Quercus suber]
MVATGRASPPRLQLRPMASKRADERTRVLSRRCRWKARGTSWLSWCQVTMWPDETSHAAAPGPPSKGRMEARGPVPRSSAV